MTPVEASRHYRGPGLGEAVWTCPSCGAENAGPVAQGCQLCGAGKPGYRVAEPPPQRQGDVATVWADRHPEASIEDAYRAGYEDGVRAVRASMKPKSTAEPTLSQTVEARQLRTLCAALELFRDQILVAQPDEVSSGEWCSAEEVTAILGKLREEEKVHA